MVQTFRSVIQGVGKYLPPKVVTNDDLAKLMDTSDEWITERSGIKERRIVEEGVATSDLATAASQAALQNAQWDVGDVDLILAATLSPDYFFPGLGVMVQRKLGAKTVPALDIRGQCSGFSWALSTADAFIRTGQYKKVLVIGAEIHSRIIEYTNRGRNISVLFGDGAGAVCIEGLPCDGERPSAHNQVRGIIDSYMGSDGSGAEALFMQRPGFHGPADFITEEEAREKSWLPFMDGRHVFKHAVTRMMEACSVVLERNQIQASDIHLLVPHQANIRINEMIANKMGLKEHQIFNNIHRYGNTTAATLPLVMADAVAEGRLKPGDLILTAAFGSGFTWSSNLIRF